MLRMDMLFGDPPSGDEWHDRRRTGIGGSDAGAVLGVSPYSSALEVWESKRGYASKHEPSERMLWGNRLQDAILEEYGERTGVGYGRGTFRRSPRHPFMVGNPDAVAKDRVIEVKTTAFKDEGWGDDGSADIPPHYYAQVQHYMVVTEKMMADVPLLVGGRSFHLYHVPADTAFQAALVMQEEAFWRYVEEGTPPEPDGSESAGRALRALFPVTYPDEVIATPEVDAYVADYFAARDIAAAAMTKMSLASQRIQAFMGARERLIGSGYRASWPTVAGQVSWKDLALALFMGDAQGVAMTDLIERFRGEPSRRFTLTEKHDA